MNIWVIEDKSYGKGVVIAETERQAFDIYFGHTMTDAEYTENQKLHDCKQIGTALVTDLPRVVV